MNIHLKTTFITAAFVCLTYGHSWAQDPSCTSIYPNNTDWTKVDCGRQPNSYGGTPCSPNNSYPIKNCYYQTQGGPQQCTVESPGPDCCNTQDNWCT